MSHRGHKRKHSDGQGDTASASGAASANACFADGNDGEEAAAAGGTGEKMYRVPAGKGWKDRPASEYEFQPNATGQMTYRPAKQHNKQKFRKLCQLCLDNGFLVSPQGNEKGCKGCSKRKLQGVADTQHSPSTSGPSSHVLHRPASSQTNDAAAGSDDVDMTEAGAAGDTVVDEDIVAFEYLNQLLATDQLLTLHSKPGQEPLLAFPGLDPDDGSLSSKQYVLVGKVGGIHICTCDNERNRLYRAALQDGLPVSSVDTNASCCVHTRVAQLHQGSEDHQRSTAKDTCTEAPPHCFVRMHPCSARDTDVFAVFPDTMAKWWTGAVVRFVAKNRQMRLMTSICTRHDCLAGGAKCRHTYFVTTKGLTESLVASAGRNMLWADATPETPLEKTKYCGSKPRFFSTDVMSEVHRAITRARADTDNATPQWRATTAKHVCGPVTTCTCNCKHEAHLDTLSANETWKTAFGYLQAKPEPSAEDFQYVRDLLTAELLKAEVNAIPPAEELEDKKTTTTPEDPVVLHRNDGACKCGCVERCDLCGEPWADTVEEGANVTIWGLPSRSGPSKLKAGFRRCTNRACPGVLHYDGTQHAVFRGTKEHALTYEVVNEWAGRCRHGGTFDQTYQSLKHGYELQNHKFLSRGTFMRILNLALCAMKPGAESFRCPICGNFHEAPTIMVDGKPIAPRRYAAQKARMGLKTETWTGDPFKRNGVDVTRSFCVPEGKIGRKLRRFAGDLKVSKGAKAVQPFKYDTETPELLQELKQSHQWLVPIVEHMEDLRRKDEESRLTAWRALLMDVAKPAPVHSGLLTVAPVKTALLLCTLAEDKHDITQEELWRLCDEWPVLYRLLVATSSVVPSLLRPLLKHVATKCDFYGAVGAKPAHSETFRQSNAQQRQFSMPVDEATDWREGTFFPGSDRIYRAERYGAKTYRVRRSQWSGARDSDNGAAQSSEEKEEEVKEDEDNQYCHKSSGKHPMLLPGVYVILCPHGYVLGYFIMAKPESPETLFSMLFERCERPKVLVVYDNACNALKFALRRNPAFFLHTIFVIDALHGYSHIGCPSSSCIKSFGQWKHIYSMAVERSNSQVDALTTQVSFLGMEAAMSLLAYEYACQNKRTTERLTAARASPHHKDHARVCEVDNIVKAHKEVLNDGDRMKKYNDDVEKLKAALNKITVQ